MMPVSTDPSKDPSSAAGAVLAAESFAIEPPPPPPGPVVETPQQRVLRLGIWESGLSSAGRVLGGSLLGTGVALTLGGSPLLLSGLGIAPLTSRLGQGVGPMMLARFGTGRVLTVAAAVERLALVGALLGAVGLTGPAASVVFVTGMTMMFFCMGLTEVGLSAVIAQVVEDGTHGRYQGARYRALALSGLVVSLVLGLLIDVLEVGQQLPPLWVRTSLMATGALIGGAAWWRVQQLVRLHAVTGRAATGRGLDPQETAEYPVGTSDSLLRRLLAAVKSLPMHILTPVLIFGFGFGMTLRNGDAALLGPMGYTLGQALWLSSVTTLVGMLTASWWGRLGDRIGAAALVPLGMAGVAGSSVLTLLGLLHDPRWAWAASLSFGFGLTGYNLLLSVWLLGQSRHRRPAPRARRRVGLRWLATYHAVFGLSAAVGTVMGGLGRQGIERVSSELGGFLGLFFFAFLFRAAGVWMAVRAVRTHHPRQWRRLRHVVRQHVVRRLMAWTRTGWSRPSLPGTPLP